MKVPRQPDRNAEARIQAAIVEWIRTVAPQVKVFHVPNGGLRGKREAAKLKWMGVLPGVPDLAIIFPNGLVRFIEVKSDWGDLSADQEEFWDWCIAHNVPNCICRSIDDARRVFAFWKIETREVRSDACDFPARRRSEPSEPSHASGNVAPAARDIAVGSSVPTVRDYQGVTLKA